LNVDEVSGLRNKIRLVLSWDFLFARLVVCFLIKYWGALSVGAWATTAHRSEGMNITAV
jgi:hypothetical protein